MHYHTYTHCIIIEMSLRRLTVAYFRQRRLWMLNVSILSLDSPKMGA